MVRFGWGAPARTFKIAAMCIIQLRSHWLAKEKEDVVLVGCGRPEPRVKRGSSQGGAREDSQRFLSLPLVGSISGGKLSPRRTPLHLRDKLGNGDLQALLCREAAWDMASGLPWKRV